MIVEKYLTRIKEYERDMSSDDSPCIYRGESECYNKVSSSLYRYYEEMGKRKGKCEWADKRWEHLWEHLPEKQKEGVLKEASEASEILSEQFADVQHLGGRTNWIDFTRNPLVALFFACFGGDNMDKKGRIIVAKESVFIKNSIMEPPPCSRNVNPLQSSILVRPQSGVVDTNAQQIKVVPVPLEKTDTMIEKIDILNELQTKGISFQSLFNVSDVHGYTRMQERLLLRVVFEEVEKVEREHPVLVKAEGYHKCKVQIKPPLCNFILDNNGERWHKIVFDRPLETKGEPKAPPIDIWPYKCGKLCIKGNMLISKNRGNYSHEILRQAHKKRKGFV